MVSSFIPTNSAITADNPPVKNDGWYPDLDPDDFKKVTGLPAIHGPERLSAELQSAMIEVNASIASWRAIQTVSSLANVVSAAYGDETEKLVLYRLAVFYRARAEFVATERDYDATKDGHAKADALEPTASDWKRKSQETLARLTGRSRAVVELI
ncbi:MAG: head completion/stabilization protein [Alphaproteobacteria bacterium]|nr:head completion/stabilization protein [Alphaproteobacteria bacterium]